MEDTSFPNAIAMPAEFVPLADFFCGCVSNENTWRLIIAELECCGRKVWDSNDGLAASVCDHLELTQHGTSIGGAWLTDAGHICLAFLRKYGEDWRDLHFIAPDGCHYGDMTI